jgi:CheY-like chemotaxis protein
MSTPLLICDDSNMARKQVARALPESWDVEVSFATNGTEALSAIRAGLGEVVLLDLTMPEMDGYAVLEAVAGDIQPAARERVTALGAIDFIKKPVSAATLEHTLQTYGLL